MNINQFYIDEENSHDEYLFVDSPMGTVIIKSDGEGIVVDIYPLHVVDEPVATTWAHASELIFKIDEEIRF